MAEGPNKVQIAVIPATKCELCEENEIRWKCFTCEEYLCDQCKKSHLKSKASKTHKVTTIVGAEKYEQYGDWEKDDTKCATHTKEDLNMYCQHCELPICRDCIANGFHQNHKLIKLEDVIEGKQKELSGIIDESNEKLSQVEYTLTSIRKVRSDHSRDISTCITEVESRNTQLKASLDQITDEVIEKLQKLQNDEEKILNTKEREEEEKKSGLKEIIDRCRDKQAQKEIGLVKFVIEIRQRLDKYKSIIPPYPIKPPVFQSKDSDMKELKILFGNLVTDEEEKEVKSQRSETAITTNITPTLDVKIIPTTEIKEPYNVGTVSDNQAWIESYESRKSTLRLVTTNGSVTQTVNTGFPVNDFTVNKSGEVYVTINGGNTVKKLNQNNTFEDFFVTPGYMKQGITVTDNNHIVVCLCRVGECKLVQLSSSGQVTNTIQYDSDGKTPLFQNPYRVSSNRNGDLIVIDSNTKGVIVVDNTGHKRFTYTGQKEGLKKSFDPRYTTTDQYGHILISDFSNNVIHLMDKDGNFLCFILSEKDGLVKPRGLSVDNSGRLWVCNGGSCKIMVVKYV